MRNGQAIISDYTPGTRHAKLSGADHVGVSPMYVCLVVCALVETNVLITLMQPCGFKWGDQHTWDFLTYTWHISSSGGPTSLYSSCYGTATC